jgi:hypothetical protein
VLWFSLLNFEVPSFSQSLGVSWGKENSLVKYSIISKNGYIRWVDSSHCIDLFKKELRHNVYQRA